MITIQYKDNISVECKLSKTSYDIINKIFPTVTELYNSYILLPLPRHRHSIIHLNIVNVIIENIRISII